jgi:hypothetical protein
VTGKPTVDAIRESSSAAQSKTCSFRAVLTDGTQVLEIYHLQQWSLTSARLAAAGEAGSG